LTGSGPSRQKENLVIISTAEHGIEGYVGAAMLKVFIEEFAPRLDPEHTGLLLVHALNPWGMKHRRKVNENSVDLNRNFVLNGNFDPGSTSISSKSRILSTHNTAYPPSLSKLALLGAGGQSPSSPPGSRSHPRPLCWDSTTRPTASITAGGATRKHNFAMEQYRQALQNYQNVLQIDMHSGYGPRYQMTVIVPPNDPMRSTEAGKKFNYPLVQKIDGQEFYAISGDMEEYFYRLREAEFPHKASFCLRLRIRHLRRFAASAHPQLEGDGIRKPVALAWSQQ
jgi:hypothetical protein